MIDLDDGEQVLNLVGVILVLLLVLGIVTIPLSAMSAQETANEMPAVNWTVTRVNESYIRITHAGGDPIRTANLSVTVDGTPRHAQWTSSFLTEDEYGVVRADKDSNIMLLWQPAAADQVVIARWRSV